MKFKPVKFLLTGLALLLISPCSLWAQGDLYNLENSRKFANHLLKKQEYKMAALEYERLVFLDPGNDTFHYQLIKVYRLTGDYQKGIRHFNSLYPKSEKASLKFSREYVKLLLLTNHYSELKAFLDVNNSMPKDKEDRAALGLLLLQKEWRAAVDFKDSIALQDPVLLAFVDRGSNLKRKSPALAAGLSTIIPGLGKVYCKNWKDGLISLVFVGANAFSAYRGFSQNGVSSVYGWVFTGIGTAFYAGNIYGSYKSAKRYNRDQENLLQHEVEHYFYSGF